MDKKAVITKLNQMLPPFNRFGATVNSNSVLSGNDKEELYSIVWNLENNIITYNVALNKTVAIVNSYPQFGNYNKNAISNTPILLTYSRMPLLIKQVLFYIYYLRKLSDHQMTINSFIRDMASVGLVKTKKFLNVAGITPNAYYSRIICGYVN